MLDKKQIGVIFWFKFKMGCKAAETTHNTSNAFGPGTANERTTQGWFKKFCKGDERALKMRSAVAGHLKLTTTNQENHLSWPSYNYTRSCQRTQCQSFYGHLAFEAKYLRQIRKVKKLGKWVPPELTENQTNCRSEVLSSLILCNNDKPFFNQIVTCNESGSYATTSSVVGPRRSSKALSRAKLASKKDHGHYLVVSCPFDPRQLSESQQQHYIWEVCSVNQCKAQKTATSAAITAQQKGPNCSPRQHQTTRCTTSMSKVERIGLQNFASSIIFTWTLSQLTTTSWNISNNFLPGKWCFHNQQETENAFQEFLKSQSMNFYATGINKLISHWQKCVDCNGFYFDQQMCLSLVTII